MSADSATRWCLGTLADALQLAFDGERDVPVDGAAPLSDAGPRELAAVYDARAGRDAPASRAGVLIVAPDLRDRLRGRNLLVARAPKAAFARAVRLLHPPAPPERGVHETAVLAEDVVLGADASIGPWAVVGRGCRLGVGVSIGAGAVLRAGVVVGEGSEIHERAVIYERTEIGPRCLILAGAVVGAPGFGHARDEEGRVIRVPHVGRVVLEEEVEVGANATIDRASFGLTRIGARTKIDNLVQVAHNVDVGRDVMIAAQCGLSGSVRVGDGVVMGGQAGVADHRVVGDGASIAAKTAVFKDVPPREVVAGIPALPIRAWRRIVAAQTRLPALLRERRAERRGTGEDGE